MELAIDILKELKTSYERNLPDLDNAIIVESDLKAAMRLEGIAIATRSYIEVLADVVKMLEARQ